MASELPIWVQYVQALAATTLSFVAACISGAIQWRMWKTAKDKLKLDLYDKRLEVFVALAKLLVPDNDDAAERQELSKKAYKAEFLFGEEVVKFVRLAVKRIDGYYTDKALIKDYRSTGDADLIKQLFTRQSELRQEIFAAQQEMLPVFSPYLSFENIK